MSVQEEGFKGEGGLLREERVRRGKGGEKRVGGKWASKPALASSLEYYLLHAAGAREWGCARKGQGIEELHRLLLSIPASPISTTIASFRAN